jgi:HK97 family phage prohead protease
MARVGGEEIDLTPTDGMAKEAQRALDWRKEGFDGGTPVGLARARQLVNKQELSPSTVRRMHSFFSRHEVDKQGEGFSPGEPGYPSNGRVAWALWGGDAGQTWARAKSETLDRLENKNIDYLLEPLDDEEDDDDDYKAAASSLKVGNFVKWRSSGGTAKGRIEHIMTEGVLGIPDSSFSIEATKDDPAVLIRIYRDGSETDTLVGHRASTLTKITEEEAMKSLKRQSMQKIFKLDSSIKSVEEGETELKIAGYASTNSIDRSSDKILSTAWTKGGLKNFQNNPILLFNHNYDKPIGRVVEVDTDSKGLRIKGVISKSAGDVYNLVKEGVLSTFSVGFMIKDADYDKSADGLIIKDAELLEVSVVSVPCNQDATFSVAKSFDNQEDYHTFKKQFVENALGGQPSAETGGSSEGANVASRKLKMDEQNTQDMINKAVADALAASQKAAEEKAAKEAAEKAAAEALEQKVVEATAKVLASSEEKIVAELEKRFQAKEIDLEKAVEGLRGELAEKSEEIRNITNSKRVFSDRGDSSQDWVKQNMSEIEDAFLLARITGKGYETKFAKQLLEKANGNSSVVVTDNLEREVSTNIERDIQNELILAPMFREIAMNSASMVLPVMPDSGYAEVVSGAGSSNATAYKGTIDARGSVGGGSGDRAGITLTEVDLRTIKLVAKSYLSNETEEDAILPILPLLREAMVRQHARGVENMFLFGAHTDGAYSGTSNLNGLIQYAAANSGALTINDGTVNTLPALTAGASGTGLLTLRKRMGKYGLRASDVAYIVSQRAYFELLEDPEFQDFNLVNTQATKLNGEVGQIFGSPVMVCDEFSTPAAGKYYALAVNTRNFVVPRQRGVTVESDYSVEDQHRVLVTSQRLGFKEIIVGAPSVFGLKYPNAS